MVSVGDIAPDFTLMAAQDRSMVTLSEIGKRTVLAFYPAAFTGVCTTELCTFSESLGDLGEAEATVLGISADNVFANKQFAEMNDIGFPLLCDVKRTAIGSYGLEISDFGAPGFTACQRAVFVVEKDGTVGYSWVAENPGMEPNYPEVISFCQT
tara:strand:- start:7274 stop:7735 length:462 start_codon:yes stop_codon:yes gene_type:complete